MSGSINKVILVGNLGKDPEVRTSQFGNKICNLTVATSESWKDRESGERRERTEWHRVAIFNENLVRIVEQFLRKGSKLYIEGKLETRKWQDNSGQDKYTTEVVLRSYSGEVVFLDRRDSSAGRGGDDRPGGYMKSQENRTGFPQESSRSTEGTSFFDYNNFMNEIDDEIPF